MAAALAGVVSGAGSAKLASATPIYWDGSGTLWSSTASWSTANNAITPNPASVPGASDVATFNITTVNLAQTVSLNANQSASGLAFNSTGTVALQGGGTNRTLSLGTSGIAVNSGAGAATIGSATSGQNVAISLQGAQSWTSSGTGALSINNGVSIGAGGNQTLTLTGTNTGSNTVAGLIANGSSTLSLAKTGTGTWLINGTAANTYTGTTSVSDGMLQIAKTAGQNALSTAAVTLGDGTGAAGSAILQYGANNDQLSNSQDVTVNSDGLFDVSGRTDTMGNLTVNYGSVTIGAGTLTVDTLTTIGGSISSTSGSLKLASNVAYNTDATNTTTTISGKLDLTSTRTFTIDDGSQAVDMEVSAVVSNGGLVKSGSGTLLLSGTNTFTGSATIAGGVLRANLGVGLNNSCRLDLEGGVLESSGSFTRSLGNGGTELRWKNNSDGGFSAFGGPLTVNINNNLSTLTWDTTSDFVVDGQRLIFGSSTADNLVDFKNPINLNGGNRTIRVDDNSNSTADIAKISGLLSSSSGAITKTGAGELQLTGTNTYTGTTTVSAGTLSINTIKNLSTNSAVGAPTTAANGTIKIGSTTTGAELVYTGTGDSTNRVIDLAGTTGGATLDQSGAGTLAFTSNLTATGAGLKTLTLQGSTAGTGSITGNIVNNSASNTTSVLKSGSGTWALSGTSTYTGTTTIGGGTLSINTIKNLSTNSALGAPTTAANGTIRIGSTTTDAVLAYTGTGDTTNRVIDLAGTTGGATLDQSGTGTLAFTSNLTATGAGSKTLTLQGSTAGTGSITGNIVDNSGSNTTSLIKSGSGTWALSGTNAYTGGTTIGGGTLAAVTGSALGSGSVTVNSTGTLDVGNGSPLTLNVVAGTYTQNAGGALKLQINSSLAGNYSVVKTTGTASLGGTLNMNVGGVGPVTDGTKFKVLDTGTRSGVFDSYTTNIGAGKAFDTSRVEKTGELSVVNHFNGFENVNGAWANSAATFSNSVNSYVFGGAMTPGGAAQVVSTVSASSNAAYGKVTPTAQAIGIGGPFPALANVGPLTRFGGNSSSFGTGFTTQLDVYLDPAWTGSANGTGFDFSSAVSDTSGNHRRDFIFHVFKDIGGTMYLAGNNNTAFKADAALASTANKLAISSAGWYTLQNSFRNNGSGVLAVDMRAYNSVGTLLFTETRIASSDVIGTTVGGNNYGWFTNIDTGSGAGNFLNVDNVKLVNGVTGAVALTAGQTFFGDATIDSLVAHIDIGGTNQAAVDNGYDYLAVTNGTATLAGELSVDLVNGFASQISSSDQFTVFQAENVLGAFTNVSDGDRVTTSDGRGSFLADYQTIGGTTALVLSDFAVVPEPSVMGIALFGAAGLMLRRPRRR